jgi:hypothetical protein
MSEMTEGERFIRGLAAALPEAFADADLGAEYNYSLETAAGDDPWVRSIALADAVEWIEQRALEVVRRRETVAVRPGGEDPLRRFFGYMEVVIARADGPADTTWIAVEMFEGIPWTEDVIAYLGPHTTALLRSAQNTLRRYSSWVGRWSDDAAGPTSSNGRADDVPPSVWRSDRGRPYSSHIMRVRRGGVTLDTFRDV